MVKALEKVEDDIDSGTDPGDPGRVPYFNTVQETISEDEIEEWDPENTLQA
jgi:hypothetical protein